MKNHKIILFFLLPLAIVACNTQVENPDIPNQEVEFVLTPAEVDATVGQPLLLEVDPMQAGIIWTSSDEAVATVIEGAVMPQAVGCAEIRATLGDYSATAKVHVYGIYKETLYLETTKLTLHTGDEYQIEARSTFGNDLTFESSNPAAVSVTEDGKLKALALGEATVTVANTDAKKKITIVVVASDDAYRLVWSDEFDGTELNRDVWNIQINGDGGGNNELQYYHEDGVSVGVEPTTGLNCLILTAQKREINGRHAISGRVNSQGKVSFTYGKIEASILMPETRDGLWPAFWMMGDNIPQVGWPRCDEIDIVEMGNVNGIKRGTQDRYFNGACHWGEAWNNMRSNAQDITLDYSVQDGKFHLWTCIWDEEYISMYVDLDKNPNAAPYCRTKISSDGSGLDPVHYFHHPNHILFNLAVGGNFPQIWDINQITALASGPRSMYVDYVRIYQMGTPKETLAYPGK